MKQIFLDTNILVDFAIGREHGDDAEQLLQHGRNGNVKLSASYLTFANMAYILRGKTDMYGLFHDLLRFITALPNDEMQLSSALSLQVRDFEDMLQYQCAKAAGCEVIVTNNKKDFIDFCSIPLMTAEELLTQISKVN